MTEQAVSQPVARFGNVRAYLSKHTNLVTFIVLALALAGLTDGASLSIDSIKNLAVAESIRAFAALGVGMIIITRGIDLSIGAVVCLVASVSASFAQNADYASAIYPGVEFPLWLPIVAGIATLPRLACLMESWLPTPSFHRSSPPSAPCPSPLAAN